MADGLSTDRVSAAFGWTRAADAGLTFRHITEADLPFLARLYASTRTEELAVTPWSAEQKAAFLAMQFQAQHAHYQQHYPTADWLVTMRGGEDVAVSISTAGRASIASSISPCCRNIADPASAAR